MMKPITKKMIHITIAIFSFFCLTSEAEQVKAENTPPATGGFSYKVNYPDNQIKKDLGYYHLKMTPGQQQEVSITFTNSSTEKIIVDVSLNSAKTNSNGVIEYGDNELVIDDSMKFNFEEIVKADKKLELEPGTTKDLVLSIKMPETSFDGVIAGGIKFMEAGQEDNPGNKGAMVVNEYAYIIGMILQETEKEVKPEFKYNSVSAGQSNFRNAILVNYSNIQSEYVEDMTVEVQITEKNKEMVLYEKKQTKMRMAPNSQIDFPVSMMGEQMKPGMYTAKILVTAKGDIRQEWTEDFEITQKQADTFNERDVGLLQEKGIDWKLIILIVVGIIIMIAIVFVIIVMIRKRNSKKQSSFDKKKNSKSAKKASSKKKKTEKND